MDCFPAAPLFSIVTATYNSSGTLHRLFQSLEAQEFQNFEHIIVDGNSSDDTLEVAFQHLRPNDSIICEPDDGLYFAMNKGIKKAKGEFICILNSDDFLDTNALKSIYEAWIRCPDTDIIYGGIKYLSDSRNFHFISHTELDRRMIYHPACFIRRTLFAELEYFDTRLRVAADYDFLLKVRNHGVKFTAVESSIAYFSDGGFSAKNRLRSILETFYIQMKHGRGPVLSSVSLFLKSSYRYIQDRFKIEFREISK